MTDQSKKVEYADNLTPEQLAWIEEVDRKMAETEKKIARGEIDISAWTSKNWREKTNPPFED